MYSDETQGQLFSFADLQREERHFVVSEKNGNRKSLQACDASSWFSLASFMRHLEWKKA